MDVKASRDDKAREVALKLRRRFSRRAVLVAGGQAGLFGLLLWRLRQLQILDTSEYRLLSDENRMTMQLVAPARGSTASAESSPRTKRTSASSSCQPFARI
jgi:hypothetical protein